MKKPAATPLSRYQWSVLAILVAMQFAVMADFMVIAPIGDILMKSLGMTTQRFGLIVSSYAFAAAAAGILAAGYIDRYRRKRVVLVCFAGFIIGTLLCGLATNSTQLLLARTVTGAFGGVAGALVMTTVADTFFPDQRGRAMGFVQMSFAAAQVLGIPMGLLISAHYDWHWTFFAIVLFALPVWVAVALVMRSDEARGAGSPSEPPLRRLLQMVSVARHRTGFAAITLLSVGGFMIVPFLSVFLVNNVHIRNEELPLIFLATGLMMLVVMPTVGMLSDRFDKYRIFLIGTAVTFSMAITVTHLPVVPLWTVMILNIVMLSGVTGRMVPFQALNSMIPGPADRGAYLSISASLRQVGGGIGAVCAGMIVHQPGGQGPIENFEIVGYVVAGIGVLCAFLVWRVSREVRSGAAVPPHPVVGAAAVR